MPEIKKTTLKFEIEDDLNPRYGHKLRGYFAQKFDDVLFHNHQKDGSQRYEYPLIQYKIIEGNPYVISFNRGAELVRENFLAVDQLRLGDKMFETMGLNLQGENIEVFVSDDESVPMLPYRYDFVTPWLGLNQENFNRYHKEIENSDEKDERDFFSSILIGNILSFAKGIDWWVEEEIKVVPDLNKTRASFKGETMLAFMGKFYSNIHLPQYTGLGQSTARGFGAITRQKTY